MNPQTRSFNGPYVVVGVMLLALAALTAWDASTMRIRAQYGVGANAASYVVATFMSVLGLAHFLGAFRQIEGSDEQTDWKAIGWIALALAGLVGAIWFGGGFILGSTLLFALTARAFGRKALIIDLLIGAAIALLVYLLFHGLLTLSLPVGPLERLL